MKIADIQFYSFNPGRRNLEVVRIESDNGYYGWGEVGLTSRDRAVRGAVSHFRDFVIGQDPRRIGRIWQEIDRSQDFEGGRVLTTGMAAIDIALHGLVARSLGVPVYQLLGGKQRDFVPCFVTTNARNLNDLVDEVKGYVADGWEWIRTLVSGLWETEGQVFAPRESVAITAEANFRASWARYTRLSTAIRTSGEAFA